MSRVALVVNTSDFYNTLYGEGKATNFLINENGQMVAVDAKSVAEEFFKLQTRLVGRDLCETDISTVQVLPYVILAKNDGIDIKYFTYQRGKAGNENRLHENFSIGVGGHIDNDISTTGGDLYKLIINEALREVKEEVGLELMPYQLAAALDNAILVHDCTNEVGKVHLGVFLVVKVLEGNQISSQEEGVLDNTSWNTFDQLFSMKLENWSRIALHPSIHPTIIRLLNS